jgi:hypothetical protein
MQNEIFELLEKSKNVSNEDALKMLYELLQKIHSQDESSVLSLWQIFSGLRIQKTSQGIIFEKALLARMTAILWDYKAEFGKYDGFSSLYGKERGVIESKINSFKKRITMVTGYEVSYEYVVFQKKSMWNVFR